MSSLNQETEVPAGVLFGVHVYGKYGEVKSSKFIDVARLDDPAVGVRLAYHRKSRGWSRGDLATRLGVSAQRVREVERSPLDAPVGLLAQICHELRIEMFDLTESTSKRY